MTHPPALHEASRQGQAPPSVIPGFYADPNLVVSNGRYLLYPTTDGFPDWAATGFRAFSSADLQTWEDLGEVFDLRSDTRWARQHAWAPAVLERDGRWFLYYTAEQENIGVAIAEAPEGPFVDLGRPLVAEGDYAGRAIDPSVFTDQDGAVYLYWGNGVAHGVRLGDDGVSFRKEEVVEWVPTAFCEAAWVHRRGDIYYLSWSENDTRDPSYRVRYATGSSPFGPWTDRGVLLEQRPEIGVLATGHHSIAQLPGLDEWVIAYHRFAIPGGSGYRREISIDRLEHTPDGLLTKVTPSLDIVRHPLP